MRVSNRQRGHQKTLSKSSCFRQGHLFATSLAKQDQCVCHSWRCWCIWAPVRSRPCYKHRPFRRKNRPQLSSDSPYGYPSSLRRSQCCKYTLGTTGFSTKITKSDLSTVSKSRLKKKEKLIFFLFNDQDKNSKKKFLNKIYGIIEH